VTLVSKETEIPIPLIVLMSVTYKQRGFMLEITLK